MALCSLAHTGHLAAATLLAAAAAGTGSAFGGSPIACAAPRELDVGSYDNCTGRVDDAWARGTISRENQIDAYRQCCNLSGGDWNVAKGVCQAPPAEQAERQPAPPPALLPGVEATLWMPPPPPPPPGPQPGQVGTPGPSVLAP